MANHTSVTTDPFSSTARSGAPPAWILVLIVGTLLISLYLLIRFHIAGGSVSGVPGAGPDTPTLRIHGSDTIGEALAPALSVAFLNGLHASNVSVKQVGKDISDMEGDVPGVPGKFVIEIAETGSKFAFIDLAASKTDIGMSSRGIKPEELTSTAALGNLASHDSEHVLGLDGVAIVVNKSNPVSELTIGQVCAIFTGEITDWAAVGGNPGPISVYALNANQGTRDVIAGRCFAKRTLMKGALELAKHPDVSSHVSGDARGIGFVGLPFILETKVLAISEGTARATTIPLYPNRLTVATEDYPLSRRLYLYTPPNPANSWTRKFVDFALSKAGQAIVNDTGFVSQTPIITYPDCSRAPRHYCELTQGMGRLTTNFHFESGKSVLQDKAVIDVGRVADSKDLADLIGNGEGIMLLGFADNVGSPIACQRVSDDRAKAVAREFGKHGINPAVIEGLGSEMPIASNDTAAGQEKNRRVEIWIKRPSKQ